jgi:hypothetical protein
MKNLINAEINTTSGGVSNALPVRKIQCSYLISIEPTRPYGEHARAAHEDMCPDMEVCLNKLNSKLEQEVLDMYKGYYGRSDCNVSINNMRLRKNGFMWV